MNFASLLRQHQCKGTSNGLGVPFTINCNHSKSPSNITANQTALRNFERENKIVLGDIFGKFMCDQNIQWLLEMDGDKVRLHKFRPSKISACQMSKISSFHKNSEVKQIRPQRLVSHCKNQSQWNQLSCTKQEYCSTQEKETCKHPKRKNYSPLHKTSHKERALKDWRGQFDQNENKFSFGDDQFLVSPRQPEIDNRQSNKYNVQDSCEELQREEENRSVSKYQVQNQPIHGVNLMEKFMEADQRKNNDEPCQGTRRTKMKKKQEGDVKFSFENQTQQIQKETIEEAAENNTSSCQSLIKEPKIQTAEQKKQVMICEMEEFVASPRTNDCRQITVSPQKQVQDDVEIQKEVCSPHQKQGKNALSRSRNEAQQQKAPQKKEIHPENPKNNQREKQKEYQHRLCPNNQHLNQAALTNLEKEGTIERQSKEKETVARPTCPGTGTLNNRLYFRSQMRELTPEKFKYPRIQPQSIIGKQTPSPATHRFQNAESPKTVNNDISEKSYTVGTPNKQKPNSYFQKDKQAQQPLSSSKNMQKLIESSQRLLQKRANTRINEDSSPLDRIGRIVLHTPQKGKIEMKQNIISPSPQTDNIKSTNQNTGNNEEITITPTIKISPSPQKEQPNKVTSPIQVKTKFGNFPLNQLATMDNQENKPKEKSLNTPKVVFGSGKGQKEVLPYIRYTETQSKFPTSNYLNSNYTYKPLGEINKAKEQGSSQMKRFEGVSMVTIDKDNKGYVNSTSGAKVMHSGNTYTVKERTYTPYFPIQQRSTLKSGVSGNCTPLQQTHFNNYKNINKEYSRTLTQTLKVKGVDSKEKHQIPQQNKVCPSNIEGVKNTESKIYSCCSSTYNSPVAEYGGRLMRIDPKQASVQFSLNHRSEEKITIGCRHQNN